MLYRTWPRLFSNRVRNRQIPSHTILAQAILEFMADKEEWEGIHTELKMELDQIAKDKLGIDPTKKFRGWPPDAPQII